MVHLKSLTCDIAIIGGSLGGVAAAWAAAEAGYQVILTEAYPWLGGQITSQAVSALDEHPHIETFGGTRRYYQLRNAIRQHYQTRYNRPDLLNAGNGWVSRLCFEPRVGLAQIERILAHPKIRLLRESSPLSATMNGSLVESVTLQAADGEVYQIQAAYFLDATDLGDLLPLTQTPYTTGTDENPEEVQSFTFGFVVDWSPHTENVIPKPEGYETFRDEQPYSLTLRGHDGIPKTYGMFTGDLPFWTYRRIFDGTLAGSSDLALINWAGNDYRNRNLIDKSPAEQTQILAEARRLSLGFLYWLQTECPRDEGGLGYPEIRLRLDVLGTEDGLSQAPYIRESRRIQAIKTIQAEAITANQPFFPDSVGLGWYAIDLHACVGNPHAGMYAATQPFQIPLGAMLSPDRPNVLPACKNIGTDHLTNGAYRVHPTEWAIGESAGLLAAFALKNQLTPHAIYQNPDLLAHFQDFLLGQGLPLAWTLSTPLDHPDFIQAQKQALQKGR